MFLARQTSPGARSSRAKPVPDRHEAARLVIRPGRLLEGISNGSPREMITTRASGDRMRLIDQLEHQSTVNSKQLPVSKCHSLLITVYWSLLTFLEMELMMINVLFVCLGNICRSPMAEAVFQQMVDKAGLTEQIKVDSAGTGSWHVGETAHEGTLRILKKHNVPYDGRARQVRPQDLITPDTYILSMDQNNFGDLKRMNGHHSHLYRLLDFANPTTRQSNGLNVPDPYYTGNFEYVYELVHESCANLLATIRQNEGL